MDNVRDLVRQYNPGKSIIEVETTGGLAESRLGYYLKPGSKVTRIPRVETIELLAHAIGCPAAALFRAFALDLGYPL